jgi:hypothetical protein
MKDTAAIKKSVSLPKELHQFIEKKSRQQAKARGGSKPNYSAVLVDIISAARKSELAVST